MRSKIKWLLAAGLALPVTAWAARPSAAPVLARNVVIVPVALVPMPIMLPELPAPDLFFREIAAVQENLAELQMIAARLPMTPIPGRPTPNGQGFTQISMVSMNTPRSVCSEQIEMAPGPHGRMHVSIHRSGNDCGPMPIFRRGITSTETRMQAAPHRPANELPPPSKLIEASYPVRSGTTEPSQAG